MKNKQSYSKVPPKTKEKLNKGIQPKVPLENISKPPAKKNPAQNTTQNKK